MKRMPELFNVENITLLVVFVVSYFVSMYIQHNDPEIDLKFADYVIGFFASCVGGLIAYKFTEHITENPGEIMFWSIVASVTSPRAFKFLSNSKVQERLINTIFDRITGGKKDKTDV